MTAIAFIQKQYLLLYNSTIGAEFRIQDDDFIQLQGHIIKELLMHCWFVTSLK